MKTVAFVPIRLNSKRVPGKNLKLLGNKPLLSYILETLVKIKKIDEVYIYCSTEDIIPYLPVSVKFLKRKEYLDGDEILGQEIYDVFVHEIDADVYILAHTTSPFIKKETIKNALDKIINEDYDSAFSAEEKKTFAWYNGRPLNYSLKSVPRTQDITPVLIETSSFYMFKKEIWTKYKQRIGFNPYIAIVDSIEGIDIDYPDDFEIAEAVYKEIIITPPPPHKF
jgi:CMP-N-acetylneuraminic acid synthetase